MPFEAIQSERPKKFAAPISGLHPGAQAAVHEAAAPEVPERPPTGVQAGAHSMKTCSIVVYR
jgi:hypothetical protein